MQGQAQAPASEDETCSPAPFTSILATIEHDTARHGTTVTGHKCYHPGYEEFNPPSWPSQCAPNKDDWIDLSIPYCGDKSWHLAEEFWQCSDISIKAGRCREERDHVIKRSEIMVETPATFTIVCAR